MRCQLATGGSVLPARSTARMSAHPLRCVTLARGGGPVDCSHRRGDPRHDVGLVMTMPGGLLVDDGGREHVDELPDDLAERLIAGSREALAEAYERWAPLVYTVAVRTLGEPADAEDVTQQVFLSAWRSRHTLRPHTPTVPGWLVGITKHRIGDVRTQRYRSVRNTAAVATIARFTTQDEDVVSRVVIADEIEALGEPRGTVLRMAFLEDRPQGDIARELDLPIGTVKSHVRRGLLQLRTRLTEVDGAAS